jgi:hypothetical protein
LEDAGAAAGGADAQDASEVAKHAEISGNPRERCNMELLLLSRERRIGSKGEECKL